MPRLSFLCRTDTHVCDRSPGSWKGDYPAEIWSNLEQIGQLAKQHEVTAVLDGGDYFHVKAASKNPHALVAKSAKIHQAYPCPTWCIEGNHDVQFNNLETLDRQPLGVLYAANVFQHLREQVFKDGSVQTRVVGVPYSPVRTLADLRSIQKKPGDTFLVAVVHALAGKNPPPEVEDFFHEPVFRYGDLVTPNGPDCWIFGHWHRDQGIEVIEGKQFINQGAISRGALIRENLERTPKVALIEMTNQRLVVTSIPLVVLPASEVFDLERKKQDEAERQDLDLFVQRLVLNSDLNPTESIQQNIQSLGSFAERVRDKALYYYELAEAG